jgi:hypothetical protein
MSNVRFHITRLLDALLIGLAAFFCFGTLIAHLPSSRPNLPRMHDEFDPALQSITSVDGAVELVRGEARGFSRAKLADTADEFVRRRFFHDYSQFALGDDWVAYLAGTIRPDLRSPVLPDDILRYRRGACSQQSIVLEAIARRFGFEVASVRLAHHFMAAVKVDGEWRVYDSDREIPLRSYRLAALLKGDPAVIAAYGPFAQSIDLAGQIARGEIRLTDINRNPAPNASSLQRLTHFLSRYGWALFLLLAALRFGRPTVSSARFPASVSAIE